MSQAPVISIVDDDPSVRVATDRLVRSLGYTAYTFASADEFLKSPQLAASSCLIADVQMPHMSGTELQDALQRRGCDLPIIFITAFPDREIRSRALDAGALGFLAKPFDESALVKSIDAALDRRPPDGHAASSAPSAP